LVLDALLRSHFKPLESVSLKWLSLKAAFLFVVTSTKEVGELKALSDHKELFRFLPDDGKVVLTTSPAFLPLTLTSMALSGD